MKDEKKRNRCRGRFFSFGETAGASLMQELATDENNYKFISEAEDLISVFNTFYADMIGSDAITMSSSDAVQQTNNGYALTIHVPNAAHCQ